MEAFCRSRRADLAVLERGWRVDDRASMMRTDNLVPGVKRQIICTAITACLELIA